jgi:hypothetical protein
MLNLVAMLNNALLVDGNKRYSFLETTTSSSSPQ